MSLREVDILESLVFLRDDVAGWSAEQHLDVIEAELARRADEITKLGNKVVEQAREIDRLRSNARSEPAAGG